MKQFLLIPTSALVAAVALTSCQKEEQSCTQLATELTELLQKVTDHDSAEAAAPRADALMKRLVKAMGRPADCGGTALHKSAADEGQALLTALDQLSEQMARVYASYPSLTHDGEIDVERLKRAVGASGVTKRANAADEVKKGEAYIATYQKTNSNFEKDANNAVNGFEPCFGSSKLKEALDFREEPETSIWKIDGEADVIATPEYTEPAGGAEAPAAEGDAETADEPAEGADDAEEPAEDGAEEDSGDAAGDDDSSDDSADDSGDVDLDIDVDITSDEEETTDEESTEEESTDDEEIVVEESTDEESSDEEPAEEEESSDEDASEEESGDDVDLDFGDLDI